MKKTNLLLSITFLLISGLTYAQPPGGGQRGTQQGPPPTPNDEQIEHMVSELATEISLNNDQKTNVLALYKNHFDKIEDLNSGSSRPKREEMDALKTSFENSVKAELKKQQKPKFEAYLKKQSTQRPGQ